MAEESSKKFGYFRFWLSAANRARKRTWEPRSLSAEYIEKMLGEIRLSKNTNMDFKISVMTDTGEQRRLKISCDSGYFIVHPWGGQFYWRIQTAGVKDTEMGVPFDEAKQKIFDGLNALIDGQVEYLNQTNK